MATSRIYDAPVPAMFRVGCPMWANPSWLGRYLDANAPSPLAAYAAVFPAVEGNTTFYATPKRAVTERWAAHTSATFRFVCKLPQEVTHRRRLMDCADPLAAFFDALEPLGERAELLTVQLPPTFDPSGIELLAVFLRGLPGDHRYAVEVRHPGFFDGAANEAALAAVLTASGVEQVTLDTRMLHSRRANSPAEQQEQDTKPPLPVRFRAIGDHPIMRIIGTDDADETIAAWQDWLPIVAAWLAEGRSPTVFLHTPDNVNTPGFARRFHDDLVRRCPTIAPLPEMSTQTLFT
ncbi:MAG TPA: DUF72 domain-containing protein [Ilumatobacteraceae bacterium]|nr:DUF72 domain-containing protein [Ilumatobacteraceae bacterium]